MNYADARDPARSAAEGAQEEPTSPVRRRLFTWLGAGLAALAAALASVPLIGFLFSPVVKREPESWRSVGAVDDFPVGCCSSRCPWRLRGSSCAGTRTVSGRSRFPLWFGLLGPPVIWAARFGASYVLVPYACRWDTVLPLHAVTAAALLATGLAGWVAIRAAGPS